MCHGVASPAFPKVPSFRPYAKQIQASVFGDSGASRRLAVLPDIYGANPFYQGFAAHLAARSCVVYLIDTFAGLGDLPKASREAAFERRHRLRDREFVDAFAEFVSTEAITGVVGFCLGGLYVFELARRNVPCNLVAFYPFPQGLANQNALDVPFDYLEKVEKRHTVLVGTQDASLGPENLARLQQVAQRNRAVDLHVFEGSDHGFLADLAEEQEHRRANASHALALCEQVLGVSNGSVDPRT